MASSIVIGLFKAHVLSPIEKDCKVASCYAFSLLNALFLSHVNITVLCKLTFFFFCGDLTDLNGL